MIDAALLVRINMRLTEDAVKYNGNLGGTRDALARVFVMGVRGSYADDKAGRAAEREWLLALNMSPWPWWFRLRLFYARVRIALRRLLRGDWRVFS